MIGEPKVTLDRAIEERDQAKAMLEGVEAQRDAWLVKSLQTEEKLQKAIEERDEARDCGQPGCCAIPPGCQRCWEIRNRELVAEITSAKKKCCGACDASLEAARASACIEREKVLLARLESAEGDFAAVRKYLGYESMHITGAACRVAMERDSANAQIKALKDQLATDRASADEVASSLVKAVTDRDALQQNLVATTKLLNEMNGAALSVVAERDSLRAEVERYRRMTTYQRAVAIHEACGARGDEEPEDAVKRIIAERDAQLARSIELAAELETLRPKPAPWVIFGAEPTVVPGAMIFESPLWVLEIAERGELNFRLKNTHLNLSASFDPTGHFGPREFEDTVLSLLKVHSEHVAEASVSLPVFEKWIRYGND